MSLFLLAADARLSWSLPPSRNNPRLPQ